MTFTLRFTISNRITADLTNDRAPGFAEAAMNVDRRRGTTSQLANPVSTLRTVVSSTPSGRSVGLVGNPMRLKRLARTPRLELEFGRGSNWLQSRQHRAFGETAQGDRSIE